MVINLSKIDKIQFNLKETELSGEICYLITPKEIGIKWDQNNKYLRSILVNSIGRIINAGFYKFVNFGENLENFPVPANIENHSIIEKLDGSLLTCGIYKNNIIHRTRGTVNAETLKNGHEISYFKSKYPLIWSNLNEEQSFIFEWTSNNNKIIIDYGAESELKLIGVVNLEDYSLVNQDKLDEIALKLGVKRPKRYTFNNLEELHNVVKNWPANKEGICLYSPCGQNIWKLKSLEYLKLHSFKSNLSLKGILELFLSWGRPEKKDFCAKIEQTFDWECLNYAKLYIDEVYEKYSVFQSKIQEIRKFLSNLNGLNRKEQAKNILAFDREWASICFSLLDGKEIDDLMIKKFIKL
jgi:hypothetical protein